MYISHIKLQHTDGDVLMQVHKMHGPRDMWIITKLGGGRHRCVTPGTGGSISVGRGDPSVGLGRLRVEPRPLTATGHRLPDGCLADAHTTYDSTVRTCESITQYVM